MTDKLKQEASATSKMIDEYLELEHRSFELRQNMVKLMADYDKWLVYNYSDSPQIQEIQDNKLR